MTIREALTTASAQLAADQYLHLRDTAARDAELLLLHTLQTPRSTLFAHPDRDLTPTQLALYQTALARRLQHEPIQYIIGQQEFYGLLLNVTPAVLIPRPETELLVESVLKLLPSNNPLRIADIGAGSGAIAIAIATHLPQAELTALDLFPQALAVAHANAERHNVAHRIRFLQSDLLSAVAHEAPFEAILSNPPYIPDSDRSTLHPQVRDYEPSTALFAGPTGLDIYRRLIPEAWRMLKPNGLLAMEIGHGQQNPLTALLAGWHNVSFLDDLQQIPRVVIARKPIEHAKG
jgi:release factor glutamine methyltransferase